MEEDKKSASSLEHKCSNCSNAVDTSLAHTMDKTSKNGAECERASETSKNSPESSPGLPSKPKSPEDASTDNHDAVSQPPAMWGDHLLNVIRKILPDEPLQPGDIDVAQAYAGPSKTAPGSPADTDLSSWGSGWSTPGAKHDCAQGSVVADGGDTRSEPGRVTQDGKDDHDRLFGQDSSIDEARTVAAQVLAAIPTVNKRTPLPSIQPTTSSKASKRELEPDFDNSSSSAPSPKVLRSPIWRSLVPMPPPAGGYWTPSATEEGEKNTPMCPPCKSGKKGRCYGGLTGLPCDRCREKGYSKERCEGSLVFQFNPRNRKSKKEVGKAAKKDVTNGEGLKRDAFGRFV